MENQSLGDKTAKGLFWGGISNGVQQLLNLVFGIFLARLLSPGDYGMVGMLSIFSLIASTLQESGFTAALVNRPAIKDSDYNAVFWFSASMGLGLYVLLYFCAPIIADFYHQPALVELSRFCFLGFFVSSLGTAHNAYLFKQLKVKQRSMAQMAALFVSGIVGVTMAFYGFAYWGIATQGLVYVSVNTLLLWLISGFHPSLHLDFRPLRGMIAFSSKLLLTNIFQNINNNLLTVVFGRFYKPQQVGLYNQASKWTSMGNSVILGMVNGVAQPTLRSVADDDERQLRVFRKMLRFTAFISFPTLFGFALVAPELITIAIGIKWVGCALLMQMLCVGSAFSPIQNLYGNLIISRGHSDYYLYSTIGLGIFQIISALLLHRWGINTMVVGYVVINVLWLMVWHTMARKQLKLPFLQALKDILPFFIIAGGIMIAVAFLSGLVANIYLRIALKFFLAVILYVAVMKLSGAVTFQESLNYLLKKRAGKE